MAGAVIFRYSLDVQRFNRPIKAKIRWGALFVFTMAIWGGGYTFQRQFTREATVDSSTIAVDEAYNESDPVWDAGSRISDASELVDDSEGDAEVPRRPEMAASSPFTSHFPPAPREMYQDLERGITDNDIELDEIDPGSSHRLGPMRKNGFEDTSDPDHVSNNGQNSTAHLML